MSNYTITTDFGAKDSLPSSNSAKVVRGSEFTTEFTNIQTAIATKADTAGDTFTGVVNFSADVAVNTNTLFVDVSEAKVGIGTTTPSAVLHVQSSTGSVGFNYGTSTSPERGNLWYDTDGTSWQFNIGKVQSGSFTPQVTVQTSGNVGIGETNPADKLQVTDGAVRIKSTFPRIYFEDTNQNSDYSIMNSDGSFSIYDDTNAVYRMRIDASGRLLVGTTDNSVYDNTSGGNTGFVYRPNHLLQVARETTTSTQSIMNLNKMGVDGNIIEFYKDGSNVGSIGSASSGYSLYTHAGDVGLKFEPLADDIKPCTTAGANRDGAIDLGDSAARFKDLYLSGNVNLGDSHIIGDDGFDNLTLISSSPEGIVYGSNTDHIFKTGATGLGATGTERMRIDSSGDMTLGTTGKNSATTLTVTNNDGYASTLLLNQHQSGAASIAVPASENALQFNRFNGTSLEEAMRIDSSGNVLVGTTTLDVANQTGSVTGVRIAAVGNIQAASQGIAAYFNRLDSDGTIAEFRKDGTTVGSIGTVSGDIRIGGSDDNHAGIRFAASTKSVIPVKNTDGDLSDNTTDLGASNSRFKDLHLSGSGYFGGNVGIGTTSFTSKFHVGGNMTDYLYSEPAGDSIATFAPITTGSSSAMNVNIGSGMYGSAGVETARLNFLNGHGNDGFATGFSIKSYKTASATATDEYLAFEEIHRAGTTGVTHNERMRIDSSGNVLVGTTSATAMGTINTGVVLRDNASSYFARNSNGSILVFYSGSGGAGSITVSGNTSAYNTSSDERLKENIADSADAGSKVDAIQIRQFDWKADGTHQNYGVIAQELVTVAPEAVHQPEDSEEMMGVDYSKLVPMLIKEVQSLRSRVAELENA